MTDFIYFADCLSERSRSACGDGETPGPCPPDGSENGHKGKSGPAKLSGTAFWFSGMYTKVLHAVPNSSRTASAAAMKPARSATRAAGMAYRVFRMPAEPK